MRSYRCPRILIHLGLVGALLSAIPIYAGEQDGRTLRVLCYNIHHGEGTDGKVDLPRLAAVIKNARPDLVALQEVDHKTQRTQGVDQAAELARLTGLNGRFGRQIDFEGGQYGQAILSRFPMSGVRIHWLPGTPDRERRIAVEVDVQVDDHKLAFVTTHLHHIHDTFREQQATKLNELFSRAEPPTILAGDLNANPDSKSQAILEKQWQAPTPNAPLLTFPAGEPTKQIDYILMRPAARFRVISTEVLDQPVASDHRPLLSVLEFFNR